jgi:hypothetical protein
MQKLVEYKSQVLDAAIQRGYLTEHGEEVGAPRLQPAMDSQFVNKFGQDIVPNMPQLLQLTLSY